MASSNSPNLECRMYEERYQEKETPVVVCVIAKMGTYVTLSVYNTAETVLIDLEELYINVGWPLHRKYGLAYENQGISVLNNAIEAYKEEIEQYNGKVVVKEAPETVSEYEDQKLLADHTAESGSNNVEVGDDNLGEGDGELNSRIAGIFCII